MNILYFILFNFFEKNININDLNFEKKNIYLESSDYLDKIISLILQKFLILCHNII